jgi:hypothetical protein
MNAMERFFMVDSIEKPDNTDHVTYLSLISLIEQIQARLQWSEIVYIILNLFVFFPSIFFVTSIFQRPLNLIHPFDLVFCLFSFAIGIMINTYWTISSIRLQLKLKLKYFHARNFERKLNCPGMFFLSDEARYFNPEIGKVESADGKETVSYPNQGPSRMDGFIGSAKPRLLSLMIPSIFFIIYNVSFCSILSFALQFLL